MSDYQRLLIQSDIGARTNFDYDPRVRFAANFSNYSIEPFTGNVPSSNPPVDPSLYTDIPTGSHSDPNIVQATPKTHMVKRYVIMDTSQRDWIKQPNPYSNLIFAFGKQSGVATNPPVYYNNPFVPTFSVEQLALAAPIPGLPNVGGWSLPASPSNIQFPSYNSSLPKGNFVGYDNGYLIQPSGSGFESVFTPCNVAAIRLVRAVLPQRQFLSLPIVPAIKIASASGSGVQITYTTVEPHGFSLGQNVTVTGMIDQSFNVVGTIAYPTTSTPNQFVIVNTYNGTETNSTGIASSDDGVISQFVQSNISDKPYSTFSTYPYLLFYLNEYFGQYVGGNEPIRRSFSVMTQKQRTQTNFQTTVGVQQYDYEPWGEEALHLQSPITNLQKLQISVADPVGNIFAQNDTLSISLIQATPSGMYLKCFTSSFSYFNGNDLRVGDRILFYSNTINDMLKSPILSALNADKKLFISSLLNNTFPILELLDYVPDSNGIYNPRGSNQARTTPYLSSYNGFLIPNFVTADVGGNVQPTYPNAADPITGTMIEPNTLVGSNLQLMNTTLQPVYTLELDILQPDTSQIGGSIVL
jgi:hypothetical protein